MTDIRFYHLTSTPLERALPKLLEKAREADFRVLVKTDEETIEELNTALWTYDPASFLAHGSAKDGHGEEQPIYLTASNDNPNGAKLLAVTDGSQPDFAGFERVLDLFDGSDETSVNAARARWKSYTDAGHELQYWQQTETGGWTKKG